MSTTTDIVVIGGGIAGISAAAVLAQTARVTVLETEAHIAHHATGRSAAIFIRNYGNMTLRALNAQAFPLLNGGLLGDSVLSPRGELLLVRQDSLAELDNYLAGAEGLEVLTPQEALELVPVLRRDTFVKATYEPDAQDIDVDRLVQGYLRQFKACGGVLHVNTPVTALSPEKAGWRVSTPQGDFSAGIVVNAAGAWADEVAALAGLQQIGLQPYRRSAVIMPLANPHSDYQSWPLFGTIDEGWYAKPETTGLMISPADEDPVPPQDIWPDDMVLAEGLHRFEQMVDLPILRPRHSWAGLRSFVPDRTPVCGFAPDAQGFFWLAGQGGYGVQTAPALATLAADICLENTPRLPANLVAALSPARFAAAG